MIRIFIAISVAFISTLVIFTIWFNLFGSFYPPQMVPPSNIAIIIFSVISITYTTIDLLHSTLSRHIQ